MGDVTAWGEGAMLFEEMLIQILKQQKPFRAQPFKKKKTLHANRDIAHL